MTGFGRGLDGSEEFKDSVPLDVVVLELEFGTEVPEGDVLATEDEFDG